MTEPITDAIGREIHVGDTVAYAQTDVALGVLLRPLRHQAGQQVFADCEAGSDQQRRGVLVREQGLNLGRLLNQGLGLGQQRAPVLVEQQAPADAVEQFLPEHGLKFG